MSSITKTCTLRLNGLFYQARLEVLIICIRVLIRVSVVALLSLASTTAFADEPPTFTAPAGGFQIRIPENIASGTVLEPPIEAIDPEGERLSYSLPPNSAPFAINLITGALQVLYTGTSPFNFETQNTYTLTVTTAESRDDTAGGINNTATTEVTIIVENIDDVVPTIKPNQVFSIPAQATNGSIIGQIDFTDPDSTTFFFATDPESVPFTIDDKTGIFTLSLAAEVQLLPALPSVYEFGVTVTDAAGNTSDQVQIMVLVRNGSNVAERETEIELLSDMQAVGTARHIINSVRSRLSANKTASIRRFYLTESSANTKEIEEPEINNIPKGETAVEINLNTRDGQGNYGKADKEYFGSPESISFWGQAQRDIVNGNPGLNHGQLGYDGEIESATIGVEKYLNENFALGFTTTVNRFGFNYQLQSEEASRLTTTGRFEEESFLVSIYSIIKPSKNIYFWGVLSGGDGHATDIRNVSEIDSSDENTGADTDMALFALGTDLHFVLGKSFIKLNIDVNASVQNLYKRIDNISYANSFADTNLSQNKSYLLTLQAGLVARLLVNLGPFGQFQPYIGIDTIHNLAEYYLDDRHAFDVSTGVSWQLGKYLSATVAGYYELDRNDQDYKGFSASIRLLAKPGVDGFEFNLTSNQGVIPQNQQTVATQIPLPYYDDPSTNPWAFNLESAYQFHHGHRILTPYFRIGSRTAKIDSYTVGLRFLSNTDWLLDISVAQTNYNKLENSVLLKINKNFNGLDY